MKKQAIALSGLMKNLMEIGEYSYQHNFDDMGNALKPKNRGLGGRDCQKNNKLDTVMLLKKKYSTIWGKRGYAKKIAYESKCDPRTIQRYFKEYP